MKSDDPRLIEYRVERQLDQLYAELLWASPERAAVLERLIAQAEKSLADIRDKAALGRHPDLGVVGTTKKGGGPFLGATTTGIDATITLRMSHLPTSILHLLEADTHPLVSFNLKWIPKPGQKFARLCVRSRVEGYSAECVTTIELEPTRTTADPVHQLPTFFQDRLRTVTELTRATLQVSIENLDEKTELQRSYPVWLLARTTACLSVEDPSTRAPIDMTRMLGAFVTPNALEVLDVLRDAATERGPGGMVGYQVDAAGVEAQVRAVFAALKKRGVVYVNSVISHGARPQDFMQRIRLPREALAHRSANCLDGTVLTASVLEAGSLTPGILLVPKHALLAWRTQSEGDWDYLETTMIDTHNFEDALAQGRKLAKLFKAKLDDFKEADKFRLLALDELRAEGIMPME
jgi:hypothetical protein